MQPHVFVSYSAADRLVAEKVCSAIESKGHRCWIAPRDIPAGQEFEVALLRGIDGCGAMVLILSPDSNDSPYVKNEVNRAFSNGKTIITLRLADIKPSDALAFYLARHQWADGFPPPLDDGVKRVILAIDALHSRFGPGTFSDSASSAGAVSSEVPERRVPCPENPALRQDP